MDISNEESTLLHMLTNLNADACNENNKWTYADLRSKLTLKDTYEMDNGFTWVNKHRSSIIEQSTRIIEENGIQYMIYICDKDALYESFMTFMLTALFEASVLDTGLSAGIDFEFTKTEIAVIQIAFFTNTVYDGKHTCFIWVFNPYHHPPCTSMFTNKIMTNANILKIMQGSDALDIPYIYTDLFSNNNDLFRDFAKSSVDIRFICEYIKLTLGKDRKCSIYQALLDFEIITDKKHNELLAIDGMIGIKSEHPWDIYNMLDKHILYVTYDVLYLNDLYTKVMSYKDNSYYHALTVIKEIASIVYSYKRDPDSYMLDTNVKKAVDSMNTLYHRAKKINLKSVYDDVMAKVDVVDNISIPNILNVHYIRKFTIMLFRYAIYSAYAHKYYGELYERNTTVYTGVLRMSRLHDTFSDMPHTTQFMTKFHDAINKII